MAIDCPISRLLLPMVFAIAVAGLPLGANTGGMKSVATKEIKCLASGIFGS